MRFRIIDLFLALACFQAQVYFIPNFVWSFLIILPVWILFGYRLTPVFPESDKIYSASAALIFFTAFFLIANSTRVATALYFLSSIAVFFLSFNIFVRFPGLRYSVSAVFVLLCAVVLVTTVIISPFHINPGFLMENSEGTDLRFRAISLEPNYLGYATCVANFVLIYDKFNSKQSDNAVSLYFSLGFLIVLFTKSPFAIGVFILTSLKYILKKLGKAWFFSAFGLLLFYLIAFPSERALQVISGEDSSANLRTWGSFFLAYRQIELCGFSGCGIGSGRDVLADEPMMEFFAAQDTLVLPNLFASVMVEGGWIFFSLMCFLIFHACFPKSNGARFRIIGFLSFLLVFLHAVSGSFAYDPQFWALLGLIGALNRYDGIEVVK